jgi:hypothetical protein
MTNMKFDALISAQLNSFANTTYMHVLALNPQMTPNFEIRGDCNLRRAGVDPERKNKLSTLQAT